MAKGKAKKRAKVKTKAKVKAKPRAKAKPKAKAKLKAKAKPKPRAKAKPKQIPAPPPTNKPGICDNFLSATGNYVKWQNVPPGGCEIDQAGSYWPFTPGPPLHLTANNPIQTPDATVIAGSGAWPFEVKCCANEAVKTVTVP